MAKSITLRNIPSDIFQILLREQHKVKAHRNIGRFGIEQTVYKIIRDNERCNKENEKEDKK
jgi:hypothetical protein